MGLDTSAFDSIDDIMKSLKKHLTGSEQLSQIPKIAAKLDYMRDWAKIQGDSTSVIVERIAEMIEPPSVDSVTKSTEDDNEARLEKEEADTQQRVVAGTADGKSKSDWLKIGLGVSVAGAAALVGGTKLLNRKKSKSTLASLTENPMALGGVATVASAAAGTWYFWDKIKSFFGWSSPSHDSDSESDSEPESYGEKDGAPSAAKKHAPPAKKQDGFSFCGQDLTTLAAIGGACLILVALALWSCSESPEDQEFDLEAQQYN